METPRDAESQAFIEAKRKIQQLFTNEKMPQISGNGTRSLEAWFLGPKAENADILERLIVEAIRDQVFWRRNYHPEDPFHITEKIRLSDDYLTAVDALNDGYRQLLAFLKKSVPFFSMRYQGHMNWDLTIPGILGYFAAMLYNPNNVAFEGSTATTLLEILVGDDLCRMFEYMDDSGMEPKIRPWGHITCDGTVANIEAIWSARNLKLFPLAMKAALEEETLKPSRNLEITLPDGKRSKLTSLNTWQLLNLKSDDVLGLPGRITSEFPEIKQATVTKALEKFSIQQLGFQEFSRRFLSDIQNPLVFTVPGTKHYSFPKAAALLGMGAANMIDVPVDTKARLNIDKLREVLNRCLSDKIPVTTVVGVIGTTEESAVDPISSILELREDLRKKGLDFTIHADAAWGGYHASVVRDDFDMPNLKAGFMADQPVATILSKYVTKQIKSLKHVDSITVDPHKSGYIPYPAGALCYRNSAMRDLVTFSAPVIFHGEAEPTVGIYGVEGSKPGASVAAVYLSHRVIRPSKSGYGKIISQALYSCKRLYVRLVCMSAPNDNFVVVPVSDLNLVDKVPGATLDAKIAFIRENIDQKFNHEIASNINLLKILPELGPDQNILAYAFNFKNNEILNNDLKLMNAFNKALYNRLSISPGEDINKYDLIVSTTDLTRSTYGDDFFKDYAARLGITEINDDHITVLRSVVMDPWVTETTKFAADGEQQVVSFIDVLEREFRKVVFSAIKEIQPTNKRGY